jgi:hypothetical protein
VSEGKYANGLPCFKQCGFLAHSLHDMYEHYKAEPTHHRLYEPRLKRAKKFAHLVPKVKVGQETGFRKHLSVVGSKVNGSARGGYKPSVKNSFDVVINHLKAEIAHSQDVLAGLIAAQKAGL